jgi:alanyl-tRNA synthetase
VVHRHAALRQVLGSHVTQAGSLVEPDRLRFDFTHNFPLTAQQIEQVEDWVNSVIQTATPVHVTEMEYEVALEKKAMALFTEKYGGKELVRVVQVGDKSTELCVRNSQKLLFQESLSNFQFFFYRVELTHPRVLNCFASRLCLS